jgi:hypothetical protein
MVAKKALNNLKRVEPKETAGRMLQGHSSIAGAMLWMFAVSVLLTFALGWIPLVGPFIGPAVGGYIGGRRAGSVTRALLAAMLPALVLSILILSIGVVAAGFADLPVLGAVAAIVAGVVALILVIHNLVLFLSALIGGLVRKSEEV